MRDVETGKLRMYRDRDELPVGVVLRSCLPCRRTSPPILLRRQSIAVFEAGYCYQTHSVVDVRAYHDDRLRQAFNILPAFQ